MDRLGQRSWWGRVAGPAVVAVLATNAIIVALGTQLGSMHPLSVAGASITRFFGSSSLLGTVKVWRAFWCPGTGTLARELHTHYVSPIWLGRLSVWVDLSLITAYLVAGVVILARNHARAVPSAPHLRPVLRWAVPLLVVVAALDLVEDALQLILLRRYGDAYFTSHPCAAVIRPPGSGALDGVLTAVTRVKWGIALAVVAALVLAGIERWRSRGPRTRLALHLLRAQILVAAIAIVAFGISLQLPDLLSGLSTRQALFLILFGAVLAGSVWAMGRLIVLRQEQSAGAPPAGGCARPFPPARRARSLVARSAPFVVPLAAIQAWNIASGSASWAPMIPLAIGLLALLVGLPLGGVSACTRDTDAGDVGRAMPRVLGATCVIGVGMATLRATMDSYVQRGGIAVLLASGLVLIAGAAGLLALAGGRPRGPRAYAAGVAVLAVAVGAGCGLMIAIPVQVPQAVGGLGIVVLFLAAASLVVGALILLADWWVLRFGLPRALRGLRMKAIPVLSLLVIWGVIAAQFSFTQDASHWNVRAIGGPSNSAHPGIPLDQALGAWMQQATTRAAPSTAGTRRAIPLVIVSAWGGGIRAATWTALAMDCLFRGEKAATAAGVAGDPCLGSGPRPSDPRDVFLASGISGGSVGLVEWDANRDVPYDGSWVQQRLGADFISPSLARGLLVEAPRSLLQFTAAGRAEVLEQAWERPWTSPGGANPLQQGFLASQERRLDQGGPFLLLNGSSVGDGCSLNVSLLDVGSTVVQRAGNASSALALGDCLSYQRYLEKATPSRAAPGPLAGTADLVDFLGCSRQELDVRNSTAGLLSARFPYVSSAGRLTACGLASSTKFITDGGVVDDSGAESALAVWHAIQPMVDAHNATDTATCVVPYYVQLDNGYLPSGPPRDSGAPPNQLLAPPIALMHTTGLQSRALRAQSLAAEEFSQPFSLTGIQRSGSAAPGASGSIADRYAMIVPHAHPGLQPSLGWTLSDASRRDLEAQLYQGNAAVVSEVRGWLTNPPTCPAAAAPAPSASTTLFKAVDDERRVTYTTNPSGCQVTAGPRPNLSRPDLRCTPGSVLPQVTQSTISQTICKAGWTKTVRPSSYQTRKAKGRLYQAYGISPQPSELDHLIPLELGGSNDITNLWIEVGPIPNAKDAVENLLKHYVCDGVMTLQAARAAIVANWLTAVPHP